VEPYFVLIVSLSFSTIDSNPLEVVVSWNGVDDDFSLLMLTKMGLGSNLFTTTKSVELFGKQY
jgi:hypothetical protein